MFSPVTALPYLLNFGFSVVLSGVLTGVVVYAIQRVLVLGDWDLLLLVNCELAKLSHIYIKGSMD